MKSSKKSSRSTKSTFAARRKSSVAAEPVTETVQAPVFEDMPAMQPQKPSRINPWSVIASVVVILALVVGGFMKKNRDQVNQMKTKTIPDAVNKLTGGSMKLKSVDNLIETSGVYKFDVVFDSNGSEQKFPSYMTKDGKILFTAGTVVADIKAQAAAKPLTCSDIKKQPQATLTAFVVSRCPYGLQMQRAMKVAIDAQPALAKYLDVKYIGSVENGKIVSMHGDEEAKENLRQICIREEQPEKYWPYVSCYMKAGDDPGCESSTGVDTQKLSSCTADASRGLAYAQKDFEIATKKEIGSSPTLYSNGQQIVSESDFGGRSPDALKQIVCCASDNQPDFCKGTLSKDSVSVAFSETDAGAAGGTTTAANCGI